MDVLIFKLAKLIRRLKTVTTSRTTIENEKFNVVKLKCGSEAFNQVATVVPISTILRNIRILFRKLILWSELELYVQKN